MIISGMSGNEIYCLAQKGFAPGEIAVGNSVFSLGISGWIGSMGRALAGGEVEAVTSLISEGRHAAITRMEEEARRMGASGVTGVISDLKTLAGFTEFLSQGTGVHSDRKWNFFSSSASGIDIYCHVDAGYVPIRFAMGNIAYALGLGRGIMGGLRTIARGEVHEFSQMYNGIRHAALARLRQEAATVGANSVVDLSVQMLTHPTLGATEMLITGTAAYHERFGQLSHADQVVTSELTGEELWNLAKLGYAPVQLVMATSVYSLGVVGNLGAMLKGISRGEIPELTSLIYHARENCLDLVRREAQSLGAERVVGNKLILQEIGPGLIEVFGIGTAVKPMAGMTPETPQLITQAVIIDRDTLKDQGSLRGAPTGTPQILPQQARGGAKPGQLIGCVIAIIMFVVTILITVIAALANHSGH